MKQPTTTNEKHKSQNKTKQNKKDGNKLLHTKTVAARVFNS